jgi:mannose-6-phosphate isomerase-like protein (cupin superfamily)
MNEVIETQARGIEKFQEAARRLPQVSLPTMSFLLEGMYLRQCLIPAGTAFVGREHKKPHYFICAKGSAQVTTDKGIKLLTAGMCLMVEPGHKRAGVTVEDTVFITIHRTEYTELSEIEDDLVVFDPAARFTVGNKALPQESVCNG